VHYIEIQPTRHAGENRHPEDSSKTYKVEWKRCAEKDLRKIDRLRIPGIIEAVEALIENPLPNNL